MSWKKNVTDIEGCFLIEKPSFKDLRGEFSETYKKSEFEKLGLPAMVQDNHLVTTRGGVRAMHWQDGKFAQSKLVNVISGQIFDVIYDLRPKSISFGKFLTFDLNPESPLLFVPKGCAHGFQAVSEMSVVHYKTDIEYEPNAQRSFLWNDIDAGIPWPVEKSIVSEKDVSAPSYKEALKSV
jgi:dTDP-4-dehydrorhamnose 3,5-epimerase